MLRVCERKRELVENKHCRHGGLLLSFLFCTVLFVSQAPPAPPIQQPSKEQDFDLDALLGDLESFDPLANSATPTSPVTSPHPPTPPIPSQLQKDYNASSQVGITPQGKYR